MYNKSLYATNTGTLTDLGPTAATDGYRLKVGALTLHNNNAAVNWLQIFFSPASAVTLGTTVPDLSIPLPASSAMTWSFGGEGWRIGRTGLCVAATTLAANATAGSITYNIAAD